VVDVENMCNYGKAPGFGPLVVVESRQALKLFSDVALIVFLGEIVPLSGYSVAEEIPPGRALGGFDLESLFVTLIELVGPWLEKEFMYLVEAYVE